METIYKKSPPEKFYPLKGNIGAYGMEYNELQKLPRRTRIRIQDVGTDITYETNAGMWLEYGDLVHGDVTKVYMPLEYFEKRKS